MNEFPTLFPVVLQILTYLVLFGATLYSLILAYHWYSFGTSTRTANRAVLIYSIGFLAITIPIIILTLQHI